MNKKTYTIGIAVRNEEKTIRNMIKTLNDDIKKYKIKGNLETIICINGCTDNTEKIVKNLVKEFPLLNIKVTYSQLGVINAQKEIINKSSKDSRFIIFYDADIAVHPASTKNIIEYFKKHPEAHVITGDQKAHHIKNFWYEVYNFIGLHPEIMSERKYITGRVFAIKKSSYFVPDFLSFEDTFLSYYLVYNYGKRAIQKAPGVYISYIGPRTFKDYLKKVRRLDIEKKKIFKNFPEFKKLDIYFKKTFNYEEIKKLSLKQKFQLFLHNLILKICKKMVFLKSSINVPLKTTKGEEIYKNEQ